MQDEVEERLVTALKYHSRAAGFDTPRMVLNDGYLAIDNFTSAIIIHNEGELTTKGHDEKIEYLKNNQPHLLDDEEITFGELESYRKKWNKVRYSSANIDNRSAVRFVRTLLSFRHIVMDFFAEEESMSTRELEDRLFEKVIKRKPENVAEITEKIHQKWQSEAELAGDMGYGSKLGNKIANPSNNSYISIFTEDEDTRQIIEENDEFAENIADFYNDFLELISELRALRIKKGVKEKELTNFDFTIRLSHLAQDLDKISEEWAKMMERAIEETVEEDD